MTQMIARLEKGSLLFQVLGEIIQLVCNCSGQL